LKTILPGIILIISFGTSFAQQADSLRVKSAYEQAWDVVMKDSIISADEKALLDIIGAQSTAVDQSKAPKPQLTIKSSQTLDKSGRWPLVLQNIVIGAGLYGWGIPYVLHADDGRWYVGGTMMSAGGAFYLTYKYTKDMEMSHARTQMMRYGSLLGLRYGLGINQLLELDGGDGHEKETVWMWVLMGSIPAGHYAGEILFEKYNPTNGQAWAWSMWTGIAGITAGLAHSVVDEQPKQPEDSWDQWGNYDQAAWDEHDKEMDDWDTRKTVTQLIAYPAGIAAGYYLTSDKQYTFGDALMLMQGWGYGYFNTMMLQSLFFDDGDEDMFFLMASLGAIGHVYMYDRWIEDDDFTFGQSTLMMLGSGSGVVFGFGTAILLDITNKEPMLTLALAGYGTGTWLTRKMLDIGPDGSLAKANSNRISLNPTALSVWDSNNKLSLIPALELNISFK
jgi:hypothetical protein